MGLNCTPFVSRRNMLDGKWGAVRFQPGAFSHARKEKLCKGTRRLWADCQKEIFCYTENRTYKDIQMSGFPVYN